MFVRYKCVCMAAETEVGVRARRDGEDVVAWVREIVGGAIAADHHQRSPRCPRKTMEYAKIPVRPEQPIGAPLAADWTRET